MHNQPLVQKNYASNSFPPAVSWTTTDGSICCGRALKASIIPSVPAWLAPSLTFIRTTCSIPCWNLCQAQHHRMILHSSWILIMDKLSTVTKVFGPNKTDSNFPFPCYILEFKPRMCLLQTRDKTLICSMSKNWIEYMVWNMNFGMFQPFSFLARFKHSSKRGKDVTYITSPEEWFEVIFNLCFEVCHYASLKTPLG